MSLLKGNLFESAGSVADSINVRISHKIIQLFSEGLYSSPNKAIEELVCNSYDAGANNVHVILAADLRDADATIVVVDDGEGMNADGLKNHWIIGKSTRRNAKSGGRKPIGKFGIGKLSTYVLASKLTHICKVKNVYYAATMNYSDVVNDAEELFDIGVFNEKMISIPLRVLTKEQAYNAVRHWISGEKEGYQMLNLFGNPEPESWTVTIMSDLTSMGKKISVGRLKWVLRTAMPQRSDFHLFLDGAPVSSPDTVEPIAKLVLGKDVVQMSKPCPQDLIEREDQSEDKDSVHRYGLYHPSLLGRITGYIEIFEDELDRGKPKFEQSNGFFVYVRGRRVNVDDPGFGIERNLLRHGTFSKFRMIVHIDSLDDALRSSRESFLQGELYEEVQNFLRAAFNLARNRLVEHDRTKSPAARIAASVSSAPGSLTRKPLTALAQMVAESRATPFYLRFPLGLSPLEQSAFLEQLRQQAEGEEGLLQSTELCPLDPKDGLATFVVLEGKLLINTSHPFVAAFQELFTSSRQRLPLEMLAMAEIFVEAHLYYMGLDEGIIREIIGRRDELLRQFVKSSSQKTPGMIAQNLLDSRTNATELEIATRAAFEALGFDNVIRIGGSDNPDSTAEAYLSPDGDGVPQRYKVGIEAKSGVYVTAKELGVSGLERHMTDHNCDHHIVIGNKFATTRGELPASVREIRSYSESSGKTITLAYVDDIARLVRIVAAKRLGGLRRLRELFKECITPEQTNAWVNKLESEEPQNAPYREILETVWLLAKEQPNEPVEYAAVITELRHRTHPIRMNKTDLIECCKAMQVLGSGVVFARNNSVEIDRRPDLILDDIKVAIGEYPEAEKKTIHI